MAKQAIGTEANQAGFRLASLDAVIFAAPAFWPVLAANTLMAVVGDVFGPSVAALTLGLVPRTALARRPGWNAACDHAGGRAA